MIQLACAKYPGILAEYYQSERVMRRFLIALSFCLAAISARAAPSGYAEAQRNYDSLDRTTLQVLQIWLIAGGYTNAVPTEHFTPRTYKALQQFQTENGFAPSGRMEKGQIERLAAIADAKFAFWGFRKLIMPGHAATVWVPSGLGLTVTATASGFHYRDPEGRLSLDFVSLPQRAVKSVYERIFDDQTRDGWTIHYAYLKEAEGWFVLSTTAPNGSDHYYRYHQDGGAVTGFALEWNDAAGDVNAERIAVLDSAVLGASMKNEPFIDPPRASPPAQAKAEPVPAQPTAVPVAPPPPKEEKKGFSTGTGFFVAEDGSFVTNAHVVDGCSDIAVKTDDGSISDASREGTDVQNDLALLRLKKMSSRSKVVALRIGARLGEGVEAFGFPHSDLLSSSGNFTLGNVTALTGMHDDTRYLQISAPVQSGNSGGPLLDGSGNLVGVVSMKLNAIKVAMADGDLPQNVNFAVKSTMVAAFLDANRVTYKVAVPGAKAMEPADIADQARAMSGFVVCR